LIICNSSFRANVSAEVHEALSGTFMTKWNRNRMKDARPLTSDIKVITRNMKNDKKTIGFGSAGPVVDKTPKGKLPDLNYMKICSNIRCLVKIANRFSFKNMCYSINDMITASSFNIQNERNLIQIDEDVMGSIGIAQDLESFDIKSVLLKQFLRVTDENTTETIFLPDKGPVEKQFESKKKIANSIIKDISELAKSVIIIITPQLSQLFETVIPDEIKNTTALAIVLRDGKYYNTTNSLNEVNSKKRKFDATTEENLPNPKHSKKIKTESSNHGMFVSTKDTEYFKINEITEKTLWNRPEIFALSQLKTNRVSGYLSTKRAYDEIRKEDGNLGLGPKTLEQIKKQMLKRKRLPQDQDIQVK
jgi:hypothetical protein